MDDMLIGLLQFVSSVKFYLSDAVAKKFILVVKLDTDTELIIPEI